MCSLLDLIELVLCVFKYHILTAQQPWCAKCGGFLYSRQQAPFCRKLFCFLCHLIGWRQSWCLIWPWFGDVFGFTLLDLLERFLYMWKYACETKKRMCPSSSVHVLEGFSSHNLMQLETLYVSLDQLSDQEYHIKYQRNLRIVICIYLPDFSESWQIEICGIFRKHLT